MRNENIEFDAWLRKTSNPEVFIVRDQGGDVIGFIYRDTLQRFLEGKIKACPITHYKNEERTAWK